MYHLKVSLSFCNAAQAQVVGGGFRRLGDTGGRAEASAVVFGAQERAAFDDTDDKMVDSLGCDFDSGGIVRGGIVGGGIRGGISGRWHAAGDLRSARLLRI